MLKNFASVFVALLLLAGCSSSSSSNSGAGSASYHDGATHMNEFENQVGDRVFFALDSSSLSSAAQATLDRQAAWLIEHTRFTITVAGHCDERGTREYNLALGERRADSVAQYLINKGVEASRIETISYGKERPAVIGNNEAAWAQNRRSVTAIK